MNYTHLSMEERICIAKLYRKNFSFRQIAEFLSRSASTISMEISRNRSVKGVYQPGIATKKYRIRKHYCQKGGMVSDEEKEYIEEKLYATWSPEQIANTPCQFKMPSFKTIYCWIERGILVGGNPKVLRRKKKRVRKRTLEASINTRKV